MDHKLWLVVGAALLVGVACGAPTEPVRPSPAPTRLVSFPPASGSPMAPRQSPTPPPTTLPPVALEPVPEPTAVPRASATATALSEYEFQLVEGLREDARIDCQPRRTGLPAGAIAGIECGARADFVERVGVYMFESHQAAARVYFERLARYGLPPDSGDCSLGKPGDFVRDGDPLLFGETVMVDGDSYELQRQACFRDEHGNANLRFLGFGTGEYVGVLGRSPNIAELQDWAWGRAPGDGGHHDPTLYSSAGPCTGCAQAGG